MVAASVRNDVPLGWLLRWNLRSPLLRQSPISHASLPGKCRRSRRVDTRRAAKRTASAPLVAWRQAMRRQGRPVKALAAVWPCSLGIGCLRGRPRPALGHSGLAAVVETFWVRGTPTDQVRPARSSPAGTARCCRFWHRPARIRTPRRYMIVIGS